VTPVGGDKVDIAQIAVEAEVSVATVSRVLNGRTGVSEHVRARVEEAMQELGYVRRVRATESAPLIELVFPYFEDVWAVEIMRGVQRVAREHGMSVILTQSGNRQEPDPDWIDGVMKRGVSCVVLVFADVSEDGRNRLRARNVPFVILNPAVEAPADVPSVGSSAWSGGVLATKHLIDLGHRRIGLITGPDDLLTSRARVSGYRSAMEEAGLPVDESLIRPGSFYGADGEREGRWLLSLPDRPTAIFAGSDPQALGVYEAARALGLRIPRELSVVGFDDLEVAKLAGPPLTTVRQPLAEMAETAARIGLRLRSERSRKHLQPHLELETTLIVRGSTATPRDNARPLQ
jgi:LacI family xylobiose transport system transcriptional regulator